MLKSSNFVLEFRPSGDVQVHKRIVSIVRIYERIRFPIFGDDQDLIHIIIKLWKFKFSWHSTCLLYLKFFWELSGNPLSIFFFFTEQIRSISLLVKSNRWQLFVIFFHEIFLEVFETYFMCFAFKMIKLFFLLAISFLALKVALIFRNNFFTFDADFIFLIFLYFYF